MALNISRAEHVFEKQVANTWTQIVKDYPIPAA